MKNEKIGIAICTRVNGIVVKDFAEAYIVKDMFGSTLYIEYKKPHQMHNKISLEDGILYCDVMVPEYMSSVLPVDESKAMINLSLTGVIRMLPVKDILMICACRNFICICQANNVEDVSYRGLSDMMNELPPKYFIRIDRSTVIAKKNIIMSFNGKFATLIAGNGKSHGISNTYKNTYFEYWDELVAGHTESAQKVEMILI